MGCRPFTSTTVSKPIVRHHKARIHHRSKPLPPESWLTNSTVLGIYGRAFNVAPILGRLGMDASFSELNRQVQPYEQGISRNNDGRKVIVAVDLIYGMAMGCDYGGDCLEYLDQVGTNIVRDYIKPALKRHWLVILDDQLGTSNPDAEVHHMIRMGYLKYDNVEVAIDPEFHLVPGYTVPGIPIGSITAQQINDAQWTLNHYASRLHLRHKKILIIHQFQPGMISKRWLIRRRFPYVDPLIDEDGFGDPATKASVYHLLLGPQIRYGVKWRGIKLFLPNPYLTSHTDYPVMWWKQVFGHMPAVDGSGAKYWVRPMPNFVVIA
ncbi:MAG TPA: hypothetical protein VFB34_01020 [Chloroflexota bacterium]|nr:hypothetical protein [Chloroflexota bacterium]